MQLASGQLQLCELTLSMSDISSSVCETKYLVKDVSIIFFGLTVEEKSGLWDMTLMDKF